MKLKSIKPVPSCNSCANNAECSDIYKTFSLICSLIHQDEARNICSSVICGLAPVIQAFGKNQVTPSCNLCAQGATCASLYTGLSSICKLIHAKDARNTCAQVTCVAATILGSLEIKN